MRWALAIGVAALSVMPSTLPGDTTTTAPGGRTVNADELGKTIEVIGPIGQPLGKVVTIEGTPVDVSKRNDYWSMYIAENLFTADKVDGVALKRPAEIQLRLMPDRKLRPNTRAVFKGYQTGEFVNGPDVLQSNGWHFEVWFNVMGDQPHPLR